MVPSCCSSLLHAVDLVGRGSNLSCSVPKKVEFGFLLDGVTVLVEFLVTGGLVLSLDLGLLIEGAFESVAILEEPGTSTLRLVVGELALEVEAIGVDPLAG